MIRAGGRRLAPRCLWSIPHGGRGRRLAGRDYAQASGKADVLCRGNASRRKRWSSSTSGAASMEPVSFEIVLSELLGDDSCRFAQDAVRVER
ncbi:MAG: hypothetical protein ACLU9S_23575 [Oscillospiraceae bacterium]